MLSAEVGNTFQDLHNSLHEVKNFDKINFKSDHCFFREVPGD